MIDHMLTFQGQAVPIVVRDSVFEIYEIIKSGAGCFFHMHMVGISMKNVHHFIQLKGYQKYCLAGVTLGYKLLVNVLDCAYVKASGGLMPVAAE